MGRKLDISNLPDLILNNLDHPHWQEVGARCLSCTNCTQVCPRVSAGMQRIKIGLDGKETHPRACWDRASIPGSLSGQAATHAHRSLRYRQWLSHKLGTWKQQYGTLGCVGCGRCITWCPAEIDLTKEIPMLQRRLANGHTANRTSRCR